MCLIVSKPIVVSFTLVCQKLVIMCPLLPQLFRVWPLWPYQAALYKVLYILNLNKMAARGFWLHNLQRSSKINSSAGLSYYTEFKQDGCQRLLITQSLKINSSAAIRGNAMNLYTVNHLKTHCPLQIINFLCGSASGVAFETYWGSTFQPISLLLLNQ